MLRQATTRRNSTMALDDSSTPGRPKYAVLLAFLLAALVLLSLGTQPGLEGPLSDCLTTVLSVAIFFVVFGQPKENPAIAILLLGVLATGWARYFVEAKVDFALSVANHAIAATYYWVAVWAILRELLRTRVVGAENIRGAICGYLIAGAAWTNVNALTYLLIPAAYSVSPQIAPILADWHGGQALFSYYSFTQMLTIGYADITPVRAPATTWSLLAALFGLFYTAVVVSQFVGMAQSRRSDARDS
jgi:hypothetical protein